MIIQREIISAIKFLVKKYPIIAVTGPRQSGKTTLLKSMFPGYRYISLDGDNANISFNKSGLYTITCDVYTSMGEYISSYWIEGVVE